MHRLVIKKTLRLLFFTAILLLADLYHIPSSIRTYSVIYYKSLMHQYCLINVKGMHLAIITIKYLQKQYKLCSLPGQWRCSAIHIQDVTWQYKHFQGILINLAIYVDGRLQDSLGRNL